MYLTPELWALRKSKIKRNPHHPDNKACYLFSKSDYKAIVGRCALEKVLLTRNGKKVPLTNATIAGKLVHDLMGHTWQRKDIKTKWQHIGIHAQRLRETYMVEVRDPDGTPIKGLDESEWWVLKRPENVTFYEYADVEHKYPLPVAVRNLQGEYDFAQGRYNRAASVFMNAFWDLPEPPLEFTVSAFWDDLGFIGRLDLCRPWNDEDGFCTGFELKIGNFPPIFDPEVCFESFLLGQKLIQDYSFAAKLRVPLSVIEEIRKDGTAAFKFCPIKYLAFGEPNPLSEEPRFPSLAEWEELTRTLRHWEPAILEGIATGKFPTNRNHCRKCTMAEICNKRFEQYIDNYVKPVQLIPGIPVSIPNRRPKSANKQQRMRTLRRRPKPVQQGLKF